MCLSDAEIKQIAKELYWSHSEDVSKYSVEDGKAIIKELKYIEHIEDEANEKWLEVRFYNRFSRR